MLINGRPGPGRAGAAGILAALAVALSPGGAVAGQAPGHASAMDAKPAAQSPGLTLEAVYELVRQRSPRLEAAGALAAAAGAREADAATLPDPMFQLGAMNLSVPGFRADMPNSMAPSLQLMQMVPFPGKLGLSARIARQSTAMAEADAAELQWEVRAQAAMAFFELYEADRQIEVMTETLTLLRDFETVARAMYGAGEGRQSDVLHANVEVARMDAEIRRMQAMRDGAAARLNGILNRAAGTPVPAPVLPRLPAELPAADTLRAWAEATRPMLARGRLSVDQAATRLELARREIWPDVTVGVQYGQRGGDMGTERMAGVMVGLTLPVFASKRQYRMRDEMAAMEQMAGADLADMRAMVGARIGELLADLERDRTLVHLYRSEVLPQAEANVASALSSYRVGAVDFMTLIGARMTVNTYEQELHALVADYGRALAELEMAIGRELPAGRRALVEDR